MSEYEKALAEAGARAMQALKLAGFTAEQAPLIVRAIQAVIEVEELSDMDPRLIDGDDETDIRGY